jgi:hypothetical protein
VYVICIKEVWAYGSVCYSFSCGSRSRFWWSCNKRGKKTTPEEKHLEIVLSRANCRRRSWKMSLRSLLRIPVSILCPREGPTDGRRGWRWLLTVNSCIKVRLDLQADKYPIVVKGPFFPRVVNPRYRIRGTNVWRKRWSSKAKQLRSSVKWNPNASR